MSCLHNYPSPGLAESGRHLLAGVLFGVAGFVAGVLAFGALGSVGLEPDWGGDKAQVLSGLFFGIPLGTACGMVIARWRTLHATAGRVWAFALCSVVAALGVVVTLVLTAYLGGHILFASPLVAALFCEVACMRSRTNQCARANSR